MVIDLLHRTFFFQENSLISMLLRSLTVTTFYMVRMRSSLFLGWKLSDYVFKGFSNFRFQSGYYYDIHLDERFFALLWLVEYVNNMQSIFCVSLPVPVLLFIFLPPLVELFTFNEKSDCDKIELVLSVVSIVQSQSNYCRWFGVTFRVLWCINLSLCLADWIFEMCAFHLIISAGLYLYLLGGVSK